MDIKTKSYFIVLNSKLKSKICLKVCKVNEFKDIFGSINIFKCLKAKGNIMQFYNCYIPY